MAFQDICSERNIAYTGLSLTETYIIYTYTIICIGLEVEYLPKTLVYQTPQIILWSIRSLRLWHVYPNVENI